jgi:hypothetical protein
MGIPIVYLTEFMFLMTWWRVFPPDGNVMVKFEKIQELRGSDQIQGAESGFDQLEHPFLDFR